MLTETFKVLSVRQSLRWVLGTLAGLVAIGGVGLFAYRIALARVPQYRATLERVVRSRTGLDVRFNELGLSWGWYGPEAVFRQVELGEPGRSGVLLRASALIVGFDVWRALHTGQLEAGRVTLVAPEIDITRLWPSDVRASGPARSGGGEKGLLERWPGGRVDVEDATLTMPDPAHSDRTLQFTVQRASLSRSDRSWSVYAQALLPQRLGRTASVSLELSRAPHQGAASGTLRLIARGLQFDGWHDVLRAACPGAPYLPSAGIGNVNVRVAWVQGRVDKLVAEVHADDVALQQSGHPDEVVLQPFGSELPVGRVQAAIEVGQISPGHWQLATEGAGIGPFQIGALQADWVSGAGHRARVEGTADGRIEDVLSWLRRTPAEGVELAARDLQARGRAVFRFDTPDISRPDALHVRTRVAADWVRFAPQLPALESVSGTLTLHSGHLQRSTLNARWLGGVTTLRLAERDRGSGAPALRVQAAGALDANKLVAATGIDTGGAQVAGRTAWTGELLWNPSEDAWHARAAASFVGIASELPDPLAKPERQAAPFRIDVSGSNGAARARVAGASVSGAFELAARSDGMWIVRRGVLNFGGGKPDIDAGGTDASDGLLELRGRLVSVDLPAWLVAWRMLASAPDALPVRASLQVDELSLGGRQYPNVAVTARSREGANGGFELELDSADLAGSVRWPSEITQSSPVEAHLERIAVQDSSAPLAFAPLLAALGSSAEVHADQIVWHGHSLGMLTAHVETRGNSFVMSPLRLAGEAQDLEATVRCRSTAVCRATFELESRDAALTLRDFGFRGDVASEHALLKGDLEWPGELAPLNPAWLASVTGNLSIELANGAIRALPDDPGVPFALLLVPALLSESPAQIEDDEAAKQGEADEPRDLPPAPGLEFARLSADYSLRDGTATTSDLHFDGPAEILLNGRIGLTTQDYDCRAWILQGDERLPQALRSFVSAPRVAAAWMALRDLIAGSGDSSAELHLGGTWDAPDVRLEKSPL